MTTVTGGLGRSPINLTYDAQTLGVINAMALAAVVDKTFSNVAATYENVAHPVNGSNDGGYLIVAGAAVSAAPVNALGFDAVTVENDQSAATVKGGGDVNLQQIVLAGDGGLTYTAATGNVSVAAGGGNNTIRLGAGNDAFYSTNGDNTVVVGTGNSVIKAGSGFNSITLGSGTSEIISEGTDRIVLGSGHATIWAQTGSSDEIVGAKTAASGPGFTLTFIGSNESATVTAGAGSYDITGGYGGGVFHGGTAGNNLITAGIGNTTLVGGGAGDTITGGAGNDVLKAGAGSETLTGGGGVNEFNFTDQTAGNGGATDIITDFTAHGDFVHVTGFGSDEVQNALAHQTITASGTSVQLSDGTTIDFVGVQGLNAQNFH